MKRIIVAVTDRIGNHGDLAEVRAAIGNVGERSAAKALVERVLKQRHHGESPGDQNDGISLLTKQGSQWNGSYSGSSSPRGAFQQPKGWSSGDPNCFTVPHSSGVNG
ncbi:MAG: hypothetical protein ABI040_03505 [Rhodoferax sp.]